jgi:hypothetical protein
MCLVRDDETRVYVHSGPTPRGRGDSAAEADERRALRSTNASILLMAAVLWVCEVGGSWCSGAWKLF